MAFWDVDFTTSAGLRTAAHQGGLAFFISAVVTGIRLQTQSYPECDECGKCYG